MADLLPEGARVGPETVWGKTTANGGQSMRLDPVPQARDGIETWTVPDAAPTSSA